MANLKKMIRSYDFEPIPGRTVCYVEGEVVREFNGIITFRPTLRVWDGMVEDAANLLPGEMQTPMPGGLLRDWPSRITFWEEV